MSVNALNEIAENYFSKLNPIAERISEDIEAIRDAYEDLWRCLSQREREQIINETVIYPEAILKYALSSDGTAFDLTDFDLLCEPSRITGAKYVVDENTGLSWRDEHSGPFSWKTPSQIDLSIFGSSKSHPDTGTKQELIYNNNFNKSHREAIAPKKIWNDDSAEINWTNERCAKPQPERNGTKKVVETPDSPNVVLGGTCSKISGLCSKLKFLPGKSFSYEVKTVVSCPNASSDATILERIRATAVNKLHSTIKFVGGKSSGEKKSSNEVEESENLVHAKEGITIVRLQKPSPRVNKPKSPPPPPPPAVPSSKPSLKPEEVPNKRSSTGEKDGSEHSVLLPEGSEHSLPSVDRDSLSYERDVTSRVVHELSDDIHSMSTECTPLSGPSSDNIPKSGFDFLDNW